MVRTAALSSRRIGRGLRALLIALQCGLLLGLFSITSIPVDHTRADIWVTAPEVLSVDLGRPIPLSNTLARVRRHPGVIQAEPFMMGFAYWAKPGGTGSELCLVLGSRLTDDSLGSLDVLSPELRARLSEHGSIVVDEEELDRLGIHKVGDMAEILGHRARVVGLVHGVKSLAGPYVFCSLETAYDYLHLQGPEMTTYVLARCRQPGEAPALVQQLRQSEHISAFTAPEFSVRSRLHWLTKTKAGVALGYAAALGLLVGAVVTSQTLYAATAASLREFAVLRAWAFRAAHGYVGPVTIFSWVGLFGVCLALPAAFALAEVANSLVPRCCCQSISWRRPWPSPCSWPWCRVWRLCVRCARWNRPCSCAKSLFLKGGRGSCRAETEARQEPRPPGTDLEERPCKEAR